MKEKSKYEFEKEIEDLRYNEEFNFRQKIEILKENKTLKFLTRAGYNVFLNSVVIAFILYISLNDPTIREDLAKLPDVNVVLPDITIEKGLFEDEDIFTNFEKMIAESNNLKIDEVYTVEDLEKIETLDIKDDYTGNSEISFDIGNGKIKEMNIFELVPYMNNLKTINFENTSLTNISIDGVLANLEEINITNNSILETLTLNAPINNINKINISNNICLTKLNFGNTISGAKEICINNNTSIEEINFNNIISDCKNLEIASNSNLSLIKFDQQISSLDKLTIKGNYNISTLDFYDYDFNTISKIEINDVSSINSKFNLNEHKNIKTLNLSNSSYTGISGLNNGQSINYIDIRNTPITSFHSDKIARKLNDKVIVASDYYLYIKDKNIRSIIEEQITPDYAYYFAPSNAKSITTLDLSNIDVEYTDFIEAFPNLETVILPEAKKDAIVYKKTPITNPES